MDDPEPLPLPAGGLASKFMEGQPPSPAPPTATTNSAWTRKKSTEPTQESQMRQRLLAGRLVIANAPQLDVNALREVLLTMDTETRDARALCETKADKKVVVYRHEMDEWIDRRCMALLQPVIDDLQRYKEQTDPRVAKVRPHAPPKITARLARSPRPLSG